MSELWELANEGPYSQSHRNFTGPRVFVMPSADNWSRVNEQKFTDTVTLWIRSQIMICEVWLGNTNKTDVTFVIQTKNVLNFAVGAI